VGLIVGRHHGSNESVIGLLATLEGEQTSGPGGEAGPCLLQSFPSSSTFPPASSSERVTTVVVSAG